MKKQAKEVSPNIDDMILCNKSKLQVEYVKIDELIAADYNPRKLSESDRRSIIASLKKFGFVDPVVVNRNKDRFNIIVGGHQRVDVAKNDLHYTEIPCVFVDLDIEQEKELNIRLNKNVGKWDNDKLLSFKKDFLKDIGFKEEELSFFISEFEKEFNSINNSNCEMPLVPKFSEKYDALIIVSKNSIDTTYLKTLFKIDKAKSYKNSRTGEAMIIDVEHLKNALSDVN